MSVRGVSHRRTARRSCIASRVAAGCSRSTTEPGGRSMRSAGVGEARGRGRRTASTSRLRTAARVDARGGQQWVRVDGRAVARVPFEVVMWSRRVARRPDVPDDVARADVAERSEAAQVRVVDVAVRAEDPYLQAAEL